MLDTRNSHDHSPGQNRGQIHQRCAYSMERPWLLCLYGGRAGGAGGGGGGNGGDKGGGGGNGGDEGEAMARVTCSSLQSPQNTSQERVPIGGCDDVVT
eukprot:850619-Prymnesium_polylepis.1